MLPQNEQGHTGTLGLNISSLMGDQGNLPREASDSDGRKLFLPFARSQGFCCRLEQQWRMGCSGSSPILPTHPASPSVFLPPSPRALAPCWTSPTHSTHPHWLPAVAALGMVFQGGKLLGYFIGTRISLWKISPGSNR